MTTCTDYSDTMESTEVRDGNRERFSPDARDQAGAASQFRPQARESARTGALDTSDAELVARMHDNDAQALAEVFDRYGRLVYSVIFRVVHDASMAEDLVQETFLRVWNRVRGFDARKGSIAPWILAIAHNCAIDYLRSSGGRQRNVVSFDETDHPALHTDMESEMLGSDRSRQIQAALKKLSPNQRRAIELSYFGGLSQLEVAARMGHPLGTVKTWVRVALRNLRDDLGSPACVGV